VNISEAIRISQVVEEMLLKGIFAFQISVLTLYEEQRKLIRQQLDATGAKVHSFSRTRLKYK
jgi:superfamily I DNA and/or RNA helicase